MQGEWEIQLFGCFAARSDERHVERFVTAKARALLAYLALHRSRSNPREELVEILWPAEDFSQYRVKLNYALWALRRVLEPPGVVAGSILVCDRYTVRLSEERVTTDVAEFYSSIKRATTEEDKGRRLELLARAVELRKAELLPGFYDDWVVTERQLLDDMYLGALQQLAVLCRETSKPHRAIEYAQRILAEDALSESAHLDLIRLYLEIGQPGLAQRQLTEMQRVLREELGADLPPEALELFNTSEGPLSGLLNEGNIPAELEPVEANGTEKAPRVPVKLPPLLTRFFGREEELRQMEQIFETPEHRLATLVGLGGCGKTRLASEFGRRSLSRFSGGIWLVSLVEVHDKEHIAEAIAHVLGLHERGGHVNSERVVSELCKHTESGDLLLILDNFEQLLESGEPVVRHLLEEVPRLHCIVTSRHQLALEGEVEVAVTALPIPSVDDQNVIVCPEALLTVPSVQLFVDRAQAIRVQFQITPRNAQTIADLCNRLEGMPLAIELAAAWTQALTPAQISEQLSDRFELLVSRRKDIPPRHRSLRAAIDSSCVFLSDEARKFFAQLSVFRGGWTVEASHQVCAGDLTTNQALNLLMDLRELALIVAEETEQGMRYRMMDTIREYARELLTPEESAAVASRHADYFCALAEEANHKLAGTEQRRWLLTLDSEQMNARAALDWADSSHQIETGLRIASALSAYWVTRGRLTEASSFFERFLQIGEGEPDVEPKVRARAILGYAMITWTLSHFPRTRELSEEGIQIFTEINDPKGVANSLSMLGITELRQGNYEEARSALQESLVVAIEIEDKEGEARAYMNLGNVGLDLGEYEEAKEYQQKSLEIFSQMGDNRRMVLALNNLGTIALAQNDLDAADWYLRRAFSMWQSLGDSHGFIHTYVSLGIVELRRENFAESASFFLDGLRLIYGRGERALCAHVYRSLSRFAAKLEHNDMAARFHGMAAGAHQAFATTTQPAHTRQREVDEQELIAKMGLGHFEACFQQGQTLALPEMLQEATGYLSEIIATYARAGSGLEVKAS